MAEELKEIGKEDAPWRFISFGIVTKDNLAGEDIIKVWSPDLLPYEDGEVDTNDEDEEQTLIGFDGKPKKVKVKRKSAVTAKWHCTTDGRMTPPNVTNGETVELYQYGHDHTYYWVSNGRQPELRRLEHVVHAFSDLSEGREGFDSSSSYGHTFSTREKFVNIWTSMSDGEAFAYQLYFDTEDSRLGLHDNTGNILYIDSEAEEIHIRNSAGSYVQVIGRQVNIKGGEVKIDGVLKVSEIIADTIKSNVVISGLVAVPSGAATTLPAVGFTPFMSVGDASTAGPEVEHEETGSASARMFSPQSNQAAEVEEDDGFYSLMGEQLAELETSSPGLSEFLGKMVERMGHLETYAKKAAAHIDNLEQYIKIMER